MDVANALFRHGSQKIEFTLTFAKKSSRQGKSRTFWISRVRSTVLRVDIRDYLRIKTDIDPKIFAAIPSSTGEIQLDLILLAWYLIHCSCFWWEETVISKTSQNLSSAKNHRQIVKHYIIVLRRSHEAPLPLHPFQCPCAFIICVS